MMTPINDGENVWLGDGSPEVEVKGIEVAPHPSGHMVTATMLRDLAERIANNPELMIAGQLLIQEAVGREVEQYTLSSFSGTHIPTQLNVTPMEDDVTLFDKMVAAYLPCESYLFEDSVSIVDRSGAADGVYAGLTCYVKGAK